MTQNTHQPYERTMQPQPFPVSNCCRALLVPHSSDEGTCFYSCAACKKPCDWLTPQDSVERVSHTKHPTVTPMQPTNELPGISRVIFDFFYHGGFTDLDDNDDDLAQELTSKLMTKLKPDIAQATAEAEHQGFLKGLKEGRSYSPITSPEKRNA